MRVIPSFQARLPERNIGAMIMRGFPIAGLLIGIGFGGLWLSWAITAFAGPDAPVWPAYAVALGLFAVAVRRTGARSRLAAGTRRNRLAPLVYLAIVVGEILALNLMVYELQSHGLLAYLRPSIGLVIGLHFFPLAQLFGIPAMNLLGAVMVVAALAAFGAASLGLPLAIAVGGDALINGLSLLTTTVLPRRRSV
jgi:hypothetical protein